MFARFLLPALTALALGIVLGSAAPAFAQTPAVFAPITCATPADSAAEAEATAALTEALTDFHTRGYAGLTRHLPRMRQIMQSAPDCYPLVERRGDQLIVRALDQQSYLAILPTLDTRGLSPGIADNIYPSIALLLGAYAVENHQFDEAVRWLDRGLAWQPKHEQLTFERSSALMQLHRSDEAVASLQGLLDDPALAPLINRGRILRNMGVALIELNRLDEAEAALNEAIRVQGDDPGARSELQYIAQLRSGGRERPLELNGPGGQGESAPPPQQRGKN